MLNLDNLPEYLDVMDHRREAMPDARCADCDHYLPAGFCEAAAHILAAVAEADPDAAIPALRVIPEAEMPATRCPGFRPSFDYREELRRREEDARDTAWDDFCAAHGCGSRGDPRRIFASGLRPPA